MIPYSGRKWAGVLVAVHGSFVRGVPLRVLAFGALATVAWAIDAYVRHVRLPVGLHEVGGAVIALILAFRTNTGYARFWEGRTLWGAIVNSCRSLARIIATHAHQDEAATRAYATWIVLFAHATRRRLRDESLAPEIERLLPAEERAAMAAAAHPALQAAEELSRRLAALATRKAIDPMMTVQAERQIVSLVDCLGGCERIRGTPTPLGHVLLMQRFIALFLLSLPFAVVDSAGPLTPLLVMAVAYPVLMLDALATELDEPFGHDANDLPLTRICTTIENNLLTHAVYPERSRLVAVGQIED